MTKDKFCSNIYLRLDNPQPSRSLLSGRFNDYNRRRIRNG
nr:MAG TPA: hypothetical protein [Caudoviricetes sp.]